MVFLEDITSDQLRSYSKVQIIAWITNKLTNMTKRKIIMLLWDNLDRVPSEPTNTYYADGQIKSQVETEQDIETSATISTRTINWTYYPTGEVDTITINKDGVIKTIKHYTDGRQPTVGK